MADYYEYYGIKCPTCQPPISRELYFISMGGTWKVKSGKIRGNGLFFHFKEAIKALWPEIQQHRWFDLILKEWLAHTYVGVMGPKNSGKTLTLALIHLIDYYAFPNETTVLVCSTTKERMEDRIWGDIKKWHALARNRWDYIPGNLIEGRLRIVTDDRTATKEGRDFRNGLIGVPCKKGDKYVGVAEFQGIKNKRVRLLGDELAALPKSFIDAISTLDIQGNIKVTGAGNPAQTTDSLGVLCEPHTSIGGWDGGIDQSPKTKSWRTRFEDGVAIQLPGSDSPNFDVAPTEPAPYPFLMTRLQMEKDARTWGKTDWHYLMFNEGMMPRGQGANRVITRQLCLKHKAMENPIWLNTDRTYITALDAAYRAVGGDRCVLMRLCFGAETLASDDPGGQMVSNLINQSITGPQHKIILALLDTIIIPIAGSVTDSPEDQIVMATKAQHEKWGLGPDNFFFDAGMRTSLVTAYSRLWSPKVNSIDFGGTPDADRRVSRDIDVLAKDYYSKKVTMLWFQTRYLIEAEQARGMTEDLVLEGSMREFRHVAGNKIEVETKAEMKEKSGRSPDLYDCYCCGVEGAIQRGFVIAKLAVKDNSPRSNAWKRDLRQKAEDFHKAHALNYDV